MTDTIAAYLDRVQALTDVATPGPWTASYDEADEWTSITGQGHYDGGGWMVCPEVATCEGEPGPDSAFIAAARTDMDVMARALRAVMEAHGPERIEVTATLCLYGQCGHQPGRCPRSGEVWCEGGCGIHPCPTVRAIEAVIPGE